MTVVTIHTCECTYLMTKRGKYAISATPFSPCPVTVVCSLDFCLACPPAHLFDLPLLLAVRPPLPLCSLHPLAHDSPDEAYVCIGRRHYLVIVRVPGPSNGVAVTLATGVFVYPFNKINNFHSFSSVND